MRVLFASPSVPWPLDSGGRIRTYKLLEALARRVEVHVHVVLAREEEIEAHDALAQHAASVSFHARSLPRAPQRLSYPRRERWFWSEPLHAALARELATGTYDLVHIDELAIARTLPPDSNVPAVLHHHKIDTVLEQRLAPKGMLHQVDMWKLRRLESFSARRFPHQLVCSREDGDVLRARYPGLSCYVVESGFDPEHFRPTAASAVREKEHLLFLGTLSYGPNVDALRYLTRELMPTLRVARPGLCLDVIGLDPPPEVRAMEGPGVRIVGRVDDIRGHLERATALLIPLRIGGGTRLKLVEALGMETPIISTSVGAEGLAFRDREHLRIADSPRAFVDAVLDVVEHPLEAHAMAQRGRARALDTYTWPTLAGQLLEHWSTIHSLGVRR